MDTFDYVKDAQPTVQDELAMLRAEVSGMRSSLDELVVTIQMFAMRRADNA